jgi:hypothetical protein
MANRATSSLILYAMNMLSLISTAIPSGAKSIIEREIIRVEIFFGIILLHKKEKTSITILDTFHTIVFAVKSQR